ncbi:MAG: cellulase family glycosylhydrolase [Phycisphaerae bacterium]|nr:cellulase family glycosylhydrolase [Phycisphaerae bacterium]
MSRQALSIVLCALISAQAAIAADGFVGVKEGRFVDGAGRHVILNGINVGAKHKSTKYMSWHGPEDYARMRQWGFNCVRLLIIWAAIEPECGKYDEDYLRRMDERVAWAKAIGLYVLVDMHQDLWGEKVPGGDGAPGWATLDGGRPHVHTSDHWGDAYLTSPMIQTAFDSFWSNKPGPDGVGIQDRFALAWQHVAKRYAEEPAVIGYDLLNEPFPGTPILLASAHLARKLGEILGPDDAPSGVLGLTRLLADRDGRRKAYDALRDVKKFRALVDAAGPTITAFERTKLNSMYARVGRAIREVDRHHILFLEPSPSANVGVPCDIVPVPGSDGKPDPLQAFAPHAYDLVTETPGAGDPSTERMAFILGRLAETARRLKMPWVLGEWGAFQNRGAIPVTQLTIRMLEEDLAGSTFWYFDKGLDKRDFFKMIRRPYPQAIAGTIERYRFDPSTRALECRWREDPTITEPTRVYVSEEWYPGGVEVVLEPKGKGHALEPMGAGSGNGILLIAPTGQVCERHVTVRPKT